MLNNAMINKGLCLAAGLLLCGQLIAGERERIEAATLLDSLHQHAANAEWPAYFALYSEDAVFIGTDANERWDMASFRRFAEKTRGWVYHSQRRELLEHGELVLFDERLQHDKYGTCRGTGALVKKDGRWKLLQYHLSIPIPNEVAADISRQIGAYEKALNAH